jgi:hypothetical protein
MSRWIQTFTGRRFDVFAPNPDHIHLLDIATALAHTCRFSGHVPYHYSVGQHSLLMSRVVPPAVALEALLHDAAEAYLGDVPRPIRQGLQDYNAVMGLVETAVAQRFGLVYPWPDAIHEADMRMVITEAHAFNKDTTGWGIDAAPYGDVVVAPMYPKDVMELFIDRFLELESARVMEDQNAR